MESLSMSLQVFGVESISHNRAIIELYGYAAQPDPEMSV
jgi:hypothetical protein